MGKKIYWLLNKYRVVLVLIFIFIISSIINEKFLTINNLSNVLLNISTNGIIAVGMTIIMITGGIDLSVGSMVALTSVIVIGLQPEMSSVYGILVAIAVGILIGLANGFIIAKFKVNPFVATLGTQIFVMGLALRLANGTTITGIDPDFAYVAEMPVLGIPLSAIVLFFIVFISDYILIHTRFGRGFFAIGGNPEASRLAGMSVDLYIIAAYIFGTFTTVIGGVILTSRINTGSCNIAGDTLITVIAAVLLGGTSLSGGIGRPIYTLFGVLIIGIIGNSLNLKGIGGFAQTIIIGLLLIIVMLIDGLSKKQTILVRK